MITNENYFSKEMNMKYMSASQFKAFEECEAGALAEITGEYPREITTSMMIGKYVDAHFSKTLDLFKSQNPDIFTQKGTLKSNFEHANYIIERIENQPLAIKYLSGQTQVIKTGEIAGLPFKTMIDSYHAGKAIVDLKIMKDLDDIRKDGLKIDFIQAWKYDLQMAIYQEIEGNKLPCYIVAATKEKEPNIQIFKISQKRLDFCLEAVKSQVQRYNEIKKGLVEANRCEECNYCRWSRILTNIVNYGIDIVDNTEVLDDYSS